MRIVAVSTLRNFWTLPGRGDAEQPLRTWVQVARAADWSNPAEVKLMFRSADILPNDRVVFNIAGNKYRLVVWINYPYRVVYIRFVGTHRQYDSVDAQSI